MSSPIDSQGVLPSWFYTSAGNSVEDLQSALDSLEQSTVSESTAKPEGDADKKGPVIPLPILSPVDIQNFLVNGREAFSSVDGVSKTPLTMEMMNTRHEIMTAMLDGWSEQLVEQREEQEIREQTEVRPSLFEQLVKAEREEAEARGPDGIFITEQRVVALIMMRSEMANHTTPAEKIGLPILPGDTNGMVGGLTNYISYIATTRISMLLPIILSQTGEALSPKQAKAHGMVITMVRDVYSEQGVRQLVAMMLAADSSLSQEQMQEKLSMLRVVVLAQALAQAYHAETDGVTFEELAGMLNGEMEVGDNPMLEGLASMVHGELSRLNPKISSVLLDWIFTYIDTNYEEAHDAMEAFNNILGTSFNTQGLEQPG